MHDNAPKNHKKKNATDREEPCINTCFYFLPAVKKRSDLLQELFISPPKLKAAQ